MKKSFIHFIVVLLCACALLPNFLYPFIESNDNIFNVACPQERFGRSFMFTRPLFNHIATDQAAWHNFVQKKNHTTRASAQITGAYQDTRENRAIERYFLINGKNELLVAGGPSLTVNGECRDVRAEWVGLPSDFIGTMRINPKQTQYGVDLKYNQDIGTFLDVPFFRDSWFSVQFPLTVVNNNINLHETSLVPTFTGFPNSIAQAFNNPDWCYGRIGCNHTAIQVPWVTVMMGSPFLGERYNQIGYYTGITIPTSKKADPKYLFSPITGYNGHIAINAGVNFNVLLNKEIDHFAACWYLNLDNIFLIRAKQKRTFDLKGKPWSRYMQYHVRCSPEQPVEEIPASQQFVPGVNVLTRDAIVHPYNIVDFGTGFRFTFENKLEVEFGYGIWGHTEEWVYIICEQQTPPSIGLIGIAGTSSPDGTPHTASQSTIAKLAENDDFFVAVNDFDLDPESAASWAALNHGAHGSVNYLYFGSNVDAFVGVGWFLDFPQKNAALQTWGVWAKAGASF